MRSEILISLYVPSRITYLDLFSGYRKFGACLICRLQKFAIGTFVLVRQSYNFPQIQLADIFYVR